MKRSELKRKSWPWLRPGVARTTRETPKTRTPMKTRKVSKRFAKLRDPTYKDWIRGQDCCNCGHPWPSHPHHVRTRGAGGADRGNLAPLCPFCHSEVHTMGRKTFAMMYERDLLKIAARLRVEYESDEWVAADYTAGGGEADR